MPMVPKGVTLCNASGAHDIAVAEWVLGAILAMHRQLPALWDAQKAGKWEPPTRQLLMEGRTPRVGPMEDIHVRYNRYPSQLL